MEEERRKAAAVAPLVFTVGAKIDDVACCCNLCGDVGFREALLPCGALGCSRLQHTYCGSRYRPAIAEDVKRWRCEWCAREDVNHGGVDKEEQEEQEDSSRKRSRRVPPPYSSSPSEIKQAPPSPERSTTDKEMRTGNHREERRETTHASRATSPDVAALTDVVTHKERQSINTRGGNRALDRWKNLAKRTRLGGKKYKLLADVLC